MTTIPAGGETLAAPRKKYYLKSTASFLLVLFTMPLGHAAMILMEHYMSPGTLHVSAFLMGLAGLLMAVGGVFARRDITQTLLGLFGGLLFWTGWVEFLFQYYADRFGMEPYTDPNGKVTQPEYLIMPASFGFLMMFFVIYIFSTRTGCNFFNWIQRRLLGNRRDEVVTRPMTRHASIVTFMELNMLLWTCYVVLMFCYDTQFLGDRHPATLCLAAGCLIGSVFIFRRQLALRTWGANIRMAIATVIVLWTFVEIIGHIGLFREIWVHPTEYIAEMTVIAVAFVMLGLYVLRHALRKN